MDLEKILSQMTLEEKASLCSGRDFWHTKAIQRLGVPQVMMCDGPHGLRKQEGEGDHLGINVSIETNCYPTASALAMQSLCCWPPDMPRAEVFSLSFTSSQMAASFRDFSTILSSFTLEVMPWVRGP